ncbi:MAG: methionine--tRNA ligase subunit beta, partial [Clostridia bacterium]|nr:methionine--tRNA ligase subunit beta [Clostridia bacterium]
SSFKWGIPVDFDERHVVYVWLDALTNYITGIGYDCDGNSTEQFKTLWPADLHLIGKDIIRFHTIYWPIFLMALDLPLPKQVFGHPWLLQGGGKMSKSKGNVLYADDLCDLFGVDAVRYFVLHEMPFENDGVITWDLLIERLNADLANTLGNLVNRTVAMSNKYFGGEVKKTGVTEPVDDELKAVATGCAAKVNADMDELRVADALTEVFGLFRRCNKYIDETAPWALAKDPEKADRLSEVLYNLVESIAIGASLLRSFLPTTADKVLEQLNTAPRALDKLNAFGLYESGTKVTDKPEILFARIDPKVLQPKIEAIEEAQRAAAAPKEEPKFAPYKPEIEYGDFEKLDLRLAKIIACEEVKRSKKLLKLTVSLGNEERTVVSGIKNWYKPEDMVGKTVVLVANLKPVTLCGVESHGMILCASDPEDKALAFVTPEKALEAGFVVR